MFILKKGHQPGVYVPLRALFLVLEVEGLYYPCSENKDADQLRGYGEADLRLCFRICKKPVFSRRGSITLKVPRKQSTKLCRQSFI